MIILCVRLRVWKISWEIIQSSFFFFLQYSFGGPWAVSCNVEESSWCLINGKFSSETTKNLKLHTFDSRLHGWYRRTCRIPQLINWTSFIFRDIRPCYNTMFLIEQNYPSFRWPALPYSFLITVHNRTQQKCVAIIIAFRTWRKSALEHISSRTHHRNGSQSSSSITFETDNYACTLELFSLSESESGSVFFSSLPRLHSATWYGCSMSSGIEFSALFLSLAISLSSREKVDQCRKVDDGDSRLIATFARRPPLSLVCVVTKRHSREKSSRTG